MESRRRQITSKYFGSVWRVYQILLGTIPTRLEVLSKTEVFVDADRSVPFLRAVTSRQVRLSKAGNSKFLRKAFQYFMEGFLYFAFYLGAALHHRCLR